MIDKQLLLDSCHDFEINLPESAPDKLDTYAQLLVEWNEKMNLTAITESREIVLKHFVDSLLLLKAVELPEGASLIDVGTGAGFPSMPVKIAREDLKVTMLDSLQKRLTFLKEVNDQLGLDCTFIHSRAEDGGKQKNAERAFHVGTSLCRGVGAAAPLSFSGGYLCSQYISEKNGNQALCRNSEKPYHCHTLWRKRRCGPAPNFALCEKNRS